VRNEIYVTASHTPAILDSCLHVYLVEYCDIVIANERRRPQESTAVPVLAVRRRVCTTSYAV
jgi:hypothetical protein